MKHCLPCRREFNNVIWRSLFPGHEELSGTQLKFTLPHRYVRGISRTSTIKASPFARLRLAFGIECAVSLTSSRSTIDGWCGNILSSMRTFFPENSLRLLGAFDTVQADAPRLKRHNRQLSKKYWRGGFQSGGRYRILINVLLRLTVPLVLIAPSYKP